MTIYLISKMVKYFAEGNFIMD